MGRVRDGIDGELAGWLQAQPLFFVATAPLAADGLVNCSPKGGCGSLAVLDERTVAYLDLSGSGVETVAHLRQNGRIVLMFCSFEARPTIVRLHGHGEVVAPEDARFAELLGRFPQHPGVRSIVLVALRRVSDSCGFAVPRMDFRAERDLLDRSHEAKGPIKLADYQRTHNAVSVEGLPGMPGG